MNRGQQVSLLLAVCFCESVNIKDIAGTMKKILYIFLFCSNVFFSGCALQSDVIYIDDRVDVIERKLSKQKVMSGDTEKVLRAEYARLNNKFDTLNEQLALIEGRFDEVAFAINSQKETTSVIKFQSETIAKTTADVARRIKHLEAYIGYEPSSNSSENTKNDYNGSIGAVTQKQVAQAKSDDVALYEQAKKALDEDKLKIARELFNKLIVKYPGSDKVDNAQFWIGESYYRSKWYQKAILEYQKVIEDFPKGNKIAGAYLKQGLAFAELGEVENSRIVLKDLIKKFPRSGEALIAKKKIDKLKK